MSQNIENPTADVMAATATNHRLFWFWVLMVAATVISGIIMGPNSAHFWLWWEVGGLATATIYTTVFYIRLFTRNDETGQRLYKGIGDLVGIVPLLCAGAVLSLAGATAVTWLTSVGSGTSITGWLSFMCGSCDNHIMPLIFLVVSGIFFCSIDLIFWKKHPSQEVRREFQRGLFFNGMPVTFAFALLLLFVCRFNGNVEWGPPLKSFIGGAVAFEMLLSNTTFAILFWKPRET